MTDLLLSPRRGETYPRNSLLTDNCRSGSASSVARFCRPCEQLNGELKHSKSDDLVLQNTNSIIQSPELHHRSGVAQLSTSKVKVYSESEPKRDFFDKVVNDGVKTLKKNSYYGLNTAYDVLDPEDSIRDMITENDFYRFVLFKKHYEKYIQLSQKYEEARSMAYYLEEKYHEVKAERDELNNTKRELERRLQTRDAELAEKEAELFNQLERVVRLEEDCEKLRIEKLKFEEWKDKLQREKNEAYRQLQWQAVESEATRRGLEKARIEIIRQITLISAEKNVLENENVHLKETLKAERRGVGQYLNELSNQKKEISQNVEGLEKEIMELKLIARQSVSLSSQFKKGMRHIATCHRRKCSVCAYTRTTFGAVAPLPSENTQKINDRKLFACLQTPLQDLKNWIRPGPGAGSNTSPQDEAESLSGCSVYFAASSPVASTCTSTSEYSFHGNREFGSASPSSSFHLGDLAISFIDEVTSDASSDSGNIDEYNLPECPVLLPQSLPPPPSTSRAFSSDSGFSSELYGETKTSHSIIKEEKSVLDEVDSVKLQRTKWTASFRKLINKVSKKQTDV